ncbi:MULTISPECIES: hypothetical protein [Streptomyces]|uniref:hypothetical protein n=1 Tax=Streptomyces TaxID=1883 RepID=UPI001292876A|nr:MULTISPECIES: hypothetical protein [Streptomyces]MCX5035430.1 hypothetical protein [Streptomyces coelicoflavus]QFX81746.1 hypothetical protein GEV49_12985 [Streptomyces sp. SYP-A7193]
MTKFVSDAKPWNTVDGPSLVRSAAALQLIPENIPCLVRLQRLAAVGACLPSRPEAPRLSPSRIRSLLKDPVIGSAAVRSQEDPYNDLYIAEVPFHGGPYLVAQGLTERSAYTLGLILRSVFGPEGKTLPSTFRREASRLVQVVLRLSHTALLRAGLARGVIPPTATRVEVFVPGEHALSALCEAVTFDEAALSRIVPPQALQALDSLSVRPGAHTFTAELGPDDGMILTPLLTVGPTVVIANPGELSATLRHRLLVLATEHGCGPQLVQLIRACVLNEATEILIGCGATPLPSAAQVDDDPQISRRQFTFADDKHLDLAVVTDDLSDYDAQAPYGHWDAARIMQQLHELHETPVHPLQDDTHCLRLIINQGLGRSSFFGLRKSSRVGPRLATTVDDLRVMAELDGTDPLFLWRFAQADERLHTDAMVHSFGTLDNYGMYRDHEYSYYLSDERRPNAVMVNSDFSQALRVEAHQRYDHHVVASPHRPALVPVLALYGVDTAPIYRTHPTVSEDELLVETASLHVWIGPSQDTAGALESFQEMVIEAVAYWAWQVSLAAPNELLAMADDQGRVRITVSFDNADAWLKALAGHDTQPGKKAPWIAQQARSEGLIDLELLAAGVASLLVEDNSADRLIVQVLAEAIVGNGSDLVVSDLVERLAPVGHKKMLHAQARPMLLRPGRLPVARLVQPAVSAVVLDKLGEWLAADGIPQGTVSEDKRLDVLNKTVQHYFQRIQDLIAGLAPEGLMNQLMARHEALIRAEAHDDQVLRSRLACFGTSSQPATQIAKDSRKRVAAAQASRFLIEYAATTPPSGDQPLTLDTYDTLLAIAADLISRATLSDAIRHDFSTAQLSLLESGRLGVSRGDQYETGTDALALDRARAAMATADQISAPSAPRTAAAPSAKVEEAMLAEFGFTLTELAHGMGEIIALGDEACDDEPFTLPVTRVQQHLGSALGWADGKANAFLDRLSLRPRVKFLSVGADAWPWRYNREWSYIRRPLVRLTGVDGDVLTWAPRHVWSTGPYWVDLVYSGRLKATSATMKKLMGSIRQDHNKEFEKESERALANAGCSITAHSVGKIVGRRLMSPQGDDLGDIDALGINLDQGIIFIVESKDFEMARNPSELANEADALLRGDKSAVFKIARRARWIRTHLAPTLNHFTKSTDTRGWTVAPVVVTSRDLISSRVLTSDVPVMAIHQLTAWAAAQTRHSKRSKRRAR